jgi:hypothetical protein
MANTVALRRSSVRSAISPTTSPRCRHSRVVVRRQASDRTPRAFTRIRRRRHARLRTRSCPWGGASLAGRQRVLNPSSPGDSIRSARIVVSRSRRRHSIAIALTRRPLRIRGHFVDGGARQGRRTSTALVPSSIVHRSELHLAHQRSPSSTSVSVGQAVFRARRPSPRRQASAS